MGCQAWFCRPVSKEDIRILENKAMYAAIKYNAPEIFDWIDNNDFRWMLAAGVHTVDGIPVVDINDEDISFCDVFRVKNYPKWVIHNKRELRRKLKKKYFDLTKEQHEKLSEFWMKYPNGMIYFE